MYYRDLEYFDDGSGRKRQTPSDENLWREIFGEIMSYCDFMEQKKREPHNPNIVLLEREFEKWKGAKNRPGVHDSILLRASNNQVRAHILKEVNHLLNKKTIH